MFFYTKWSRRRAQYYEKHRRPRRPARGGAGGRGVPAPARGAGPEGRAGQGATPAPRAGQKMCGRHGRSGRGAGWQTSGHRTEGKHPATLPAKHRASRKKTPGGTPLCRPKGEPRRGGPPGAGEGAPAGARQGQPPYKGGKAPTTKRAIMLRETAMMAKDNPKQRYEHARRPRRRGAARRPGEVPETPEPRKRESAEQSPSGKQQ